MDKDDPHAEHALRSLVGANISRLMQSRPKLNSNPKLGARSGIGVATISRVINGETAATLDTLAKLAAAFDLAPWQLLVPNLDATNPQILQSISPKEADLYKRLRETIAQETEVQTHGSDSGFGHLSPFHPAAQQGQNNKKSGSK